MLKGRGLTPHHLQWQFCAWTSLIQLCIKFNREVFKRTALSQEDIFLLGISLASCPQEMPWQEQELGNDELSPESQG